MFQSKTAEWSYYVGIASAAAAIFYRILWFWELGVRIFLRFHVSPRNLVDLSILLFVLSIASNARALVRREGTNAAAAAKGR